MKHKSINIEIDLNIMQLSNWKYICSDLAVNLLLIESLIYGFFMKNGEKTWYYVSTLYVNTKKIDYQLVFGWNRKKNNRKKYFHGKLTWVFEDQYNFGCLLYPRIITWRDRKGQCFFLPLFFGDFMSFLIRKIFSFLPLYD